MRVLVAGEYSGRIRDAYLRRGHDAISCDFLPTESQGPHYQGNFFDILDDGFDLIIAHPDCTYLTTAAEWAYADVPMIKGIPRKMKSDTLIGSARRKARKQALIDIDIIWNAPAKYICIENPKGVINRFLDLPPPQYIQPHQFGEDASKLTGLWKKNLPDLIPTKIIDPRIVDGKPRWANQTDSGQNNLPPSVDRAKIRSLIAQGIADAMADQWGALSL